MLNWENMETILATNAATGTAMSEDSSSPLKTLLSSSTASETSTSSDEEAAHAPDDDNNNLCEYFSETRTNQMNQRAQLENEGLNLNLGLPVDLTAYARRRIDTTATTTTTGIVQKVLRPPIQILLRLLDRLLSLIESPLFRFWSERIPLRVRQKLTFLAWGMYLPIHKVLIARRTGLHKDVSLEYHALTSVMWWGRLFPVTVKRMRFSLSQLHVWHPPDRYPQWNLTTNNSFYKPSNGERYGIRGHLYEIYHQMEQKRTPSGFRRSTTTKQSNAEMTVTGKYIQHASQPSKKVILWIYGGAFLAGDSTGNMGIAEKMGMLCAGEEKGNNDNQNGMRDVFIPDHRLVPEHHLDDAIHDIALAYEYLIFKRGIHPADITLVGVSSGGGLVVLLLQALAEAQRAFDERKGDNERENDDGSSCVQMPAGGVVMGPFVDYTEPKGSMKEYIKHDLIVNESVYDEGIPYLEQVLGCHENRVRASPVYGNFDGLPPLCICVSEHEVVYDQAMLMAKRAKEQGVDVTVGVWKYMCHVFQLLCPFVPEGKESFDFMCEWIRER
mmetsp:Transcript_4152/g.9130  ORF Transcript_4152/g.9130 Transcript_4152/m.9130 type:complete len:555 (-) Transcript_4152:76-1740(-)